MNDTPNSPLTRKQDKSNKPEPEFDRDKVENNKANKYQGDPENPEHSSYQRNHPYAK